MATQPLYDKPVSVDEYLSTVYEHDCEYVDGVIEERDLGEFEHAYVQGLLVSLFFPKPGIVGSLSASGAARANPEDPFPCT